MMSRTERRSRKHLWTQNIRGDLLIKFSRMHLNEFRAIELVIWLSLVNEYLPFTRLFSLDFIITTLESI